MSRNCHFRVKQARPATLVGFFFFNDTATTEIYPLSLHDALPICSPSTTPAGPPPATTQPSSPSTAPPAPGGATPHPAAKIGRVTSELQSRQYLVCRLLLEKKTTYHHTLLIVPYTFRFYHHYISPS